MTARELACQLGYSIAGKHDCEISGIAYASTAQGNELAVVFDAKELETTNANLVLLKPTCIISDKTLIFTHESVSIAMVKAVYLLIETGLYPDYRLPDDLHQEERFWISSNVTIGKNTLIGAGVVIHSDVSIGENCRIGHNTVIHCGVHIGNNVVIGSNCCIGADAFYRYYENGKLKQFAGIGKVVVENGVNIGNFVNVQRGTLANTYIGEDTMIGNLVDIGHDVSIGNNCFIVSQTGCAGHVQIGNEVTLYGQVGVVGNVKIGDKVIVHGKSVVTKNIVACQEVSGNPARKHIDDLRLMAKKCRQ